VICEQLMRDLDAYVDDELAAAARHGFDMHLESCTACRRSLRERQAVGRMVRSAPYYAAPAGLRTRVTAQTARDRGRRHLGIWAAAAVLVLAAGGAAAVVRSGSNQRAAVMDEAVTGHLRSLMADHLVDVRSEDQHTVKPWFLGRLDFSPPVVDLAAAGFPLVGGRIDYLDGRPAAALVYQRRQHTINVFVVPTPEAAGGAPAADARSIKGFHVLRWTHGDLSFWTVSDLDEAELAAFVRLLQGS
jgi:anti-sigma factor RsiW